MTILLLADVDDVVSLGSSPGTEGYSVREGATGPDEGLLHQVPNEPGELLWVLAREWIAANGEQPEVPDDPWAEDLAAAKARRKAEVNLESRFLLAEYDWYRLREADGGTAMPAGVLTYRNGVRTAANDAFTAIDALSTVDECRDLVPAWPALP